LCSLKVRSQTRPRLHLLHRLLDIQELPIRGSLGPVAISDFVFPGSVISKGLCKVSSEKLPSYIGRIHGMTQVKSVVVVNVYLRKLQILHSSFTPTQIRRSDCQYIPTSRKSQNFAAP
jgi:hypothetical protein